MKKAVISVVGKDTVGIIATVCSYLAEQKINILDISQTIVHGYFNMMMIVDVTAAEATFAAVKDGLDQVGETLGVTIHCQKAEIFEKMHRI